MVERYAGRVLPAIQIRDERLKIASELLALLVRDAAVMPVRQQEHIRHAVQALQAVQQWCKDHTGL